RKVVEVHADAKEFAHACEWHAQSGAGRDNRKLARVEHRPTVQLFRSPVRDQPGNIADDPRLVQYPGTFGTCSAVANELHADQRVSSIRMKAWMDIPGRAPSADAVEFRKEITPS